MMKKFGFSSLVALMVLTAVATAPAAGKGDTQVTAKKVSSDPADINSPEWASAKEATLVNDGAAGGPFEKKTLEVKVKAVYTKGGNISVLVSWPVAKKSVTKEEWKYMNGKWTKEKTEDDKLAFNWEIKRIKNFATKGCAVVCHSESKSQDDWKYHTETATERGDMWVWRAATSDPLGHAEDGYVDDDARKSDAGTGKARKNETSDKHGPKFMQDSAKKQTAAGYILDGEIVEIKPGAKFKNNETIPSWILSKFSGSMADVKTRSQYANGRWTVMFQRKLETDDRETDVTFDTRRDYTFGMAVFNNSSKHNSYNSGPMKLIFD